MTNDRRLIEDFIPIREISLEAAREKSIRKGHISTLHGGKKNNKDNQRIRRGGSLDSPELFGVMLAIASKNQTGSGILVSDR